MEDEASDGPVFELQSWRWSSNNGIEGKCFETGYDKMKFICFFFLLFWWTWILFCFQRFGAQMLS